jgi:hypothetical protein
MQRVHSVILFTASYCSQRHPVRSVIPNRDRKGAVRTVNSRRKESETQMNKFWIPLLITALGCLATAQPANAEAFKTNAECVPGKRVADKIGQVGKIIGPTRGDPVGCDVLWDSDGKSH